MAEFKLGRIRFVWKQDWTTGTEYYKDDVVSYGGTTFICVKGHLAAADFYTDLEVSPPKWNKFADGQEWRGDWTAQTLYRKNDLVKYGGLVYICSVGHTSGSLSVGLEGALNLNDSTLSKWELYAESFEWRAEWANSQKYRERDIVKYGAINYVCKEGHTSASTIALGLENDLSKWDVLSEGTAWTGDWLVATRYKKNDVVKYGGQTFICIIGHTSASTVALGLENDQNKWDYFNKGFEYKGNWSGATKYKVNDLVKYGSGTWRCNTNHTSAGTFNVTYFEQFVKGIEFEGFWSSSVTYQPGDIVRYGGYSYIAKTVHINVLPTDTNNWDLFATSFKFEGDYSAGTTYLPGQVVRHGGYTYTCILSGTGQNPETSSSYWSRLNSGLRWRGEWVNSAVYLLGDIVKWNAGSYVCVLGHTSDDDDSTITPTSNSPGKDSGGVYWNLITGGLEDSVLTTVGDLVYYAPSGPSRLPIGTEGQILSIVNGLPAWKHWGKTNYVYYVAPHGVDTPYPVQGATLDKPWLTIRYASEQIEKGTEYSAAGYLLKQNRTFVQKEIVEWVNYQIANPTGIWVSFTNANVASCQRDMGLIIDALIYDLTHGGNARTIEVTRTYFNAAGTQLVTPMQNEYLQSAAAINYGITVIASVLANLAPAVNYQTLNGISVGSRIKQIIDFSYSAETGASSITSSLAQIVTSSLTATNLSGLPVTDQPQYTINVKTGQFYEVLPILVPKHTAIVGDELRSTRISPQVKLISNNDKAKSVSVLQRLQSITPNIIANTAVTPTTGNTVTQNRTSQIAGSIGSTTAVTSVVNNVAEIKDIFVNGLGSADAYVRPTPTGGSNNAYTAGFFDGARLINANRAFIISEVSAWINLQITNSVTEFVGFSYSGTTQTNNERAIGYLVDALVYDLTYGGNLATQIRARSYYSFGTFVGALGTTARSLLVKARIKSFIDNIVIADTAGWTKTTGLSQTVTGPAGSAGAATAAQARVQEIYDTINTGTTPTTIAPDITWPAVAILTAAAQLLAAKSTIQTDAVAYVKREFPTLKFDETVCSRDVGYMIDALIYDLRFGSNYLSIQSGISYYYGTTSTLLVLAQQSAATQAILNYLSKRAGFVVASGSTVLADLLFTDIINYVNTGTRPLITGTNTPVESIDQINGARILELNKAFMMAEATAYANNTFKATVTASNGTSETFTCATQTWMVAGDTVRFSGSVFGGINTTTTYYILASGLTSTSFKVSTQLNGTAVDLSTVASGSMTVSWYYSQARCQNDVSNYVDSIVKDIIYPGNFNSVTAARYYRNALTGSKLEDMFYVKNACGLRNCTLTGLDGTSDGNTAGAGDADGLTSANSYGTQRPLAGAYVSLDPGWGPTDTRVWVTNKSTYVQNVTTFGTGCVGQKIDGSLHAGGNDSIVSNDFTQVLSDGIGAWVTNLGRAELVSVFSYYNHIGYLAENGGKIRATNGNNSYGTFGSVAEGFDITETAITGNVNNRAFQANVRNVITTGSTVQVLEYGNAGQNYSLANVSIGGAGSGAIAVGNEIRFGGVFQVRLTDPGDSSGIGGTGYVTANNVAQGGNTTQITLAAADTAISTAYVGMAIFITSGTGAGQYGYIQTYNAGNKVATVRKYSTGTAGWDHVVPGTPIVSALDLTTIYDITPRITFTDPPYSTAIRSLPSTLDWNDVVFGDAYGSYTTVATTTNGSGLAATVNVVRRLGAYTVTINSGGTGYAVGNTLTVSGALVGGTNPANNITMTITGIDSIDTSVLTVTVSGTAISPAYIAVSGGSSTAGYSADGITWSTVSLPTAREWIAIDYGRVSNIGTYLAVARDSAFAAYSTDGINWTSSNIGEGGDWIDVAYGNGKFVAVSESDSSVTTRAVTSNGGQTWSVGSITNGAVAIAYGNGKWVEVEGNFSNTASYSSDGIAWSSTAVMPANADSTESNWRSLAFGNNRWVAIADNNGQTAYSLTGTTWIAGGQLPLNADWRKIAYGNGVFLALGDGGVAATSRDGLVWTSRSATLGTITVTSTSKDKNGGWAARTQTSGNWYSVGYGGGKYVAVRGNPNIGVSYSTDGISWNNATGITTNTDDIRSVAYGNGLWVIPYYASNDVMTSPDGVTWTYQSNVLTATRNWVSVAYGNGRFVIVADSSTTVQYSSNGTTWAAGALPSSDEWTSVAYGQIGATNYFVAVSGSTANSTAAASSTDGGQTWTARTIASNRWSSVTFGNSRFVAVAGNSGTTTTVAAYSTNGTSWTTSTLPGAAARWNNVHWNGSVFVATAYNSARSAISENGITWTEIAMTTSANWTASASDGAYNSVAIAYAGTAVHNLFYQANTNYVTAVSTTNLSVNDTLEFTGTQFGNIITNGVPPETRRYYVTAIISSTEFTLSTSLRGSDLVLSSGSGTMSGTIGKLYSTVVFGDPNTNQGFIALSRGGRKGMAFYAGVPAIGRAWVADNKLQEIWIHEPGSNYSSAPTITITDPNNTGADATSQVRIANGVLAQPSFSNRGSAYTAASATITGDGLADNYQTGAFVEFINLSAVPVAGSNLQIAGIDDVYYKTVNIRSLRRTGSTYTAQLQVSPRLGTLESPDHLTASSIRRRYSQVRLTGHDFLDIGTGNQTTTNYPALPLTGYDPIPANETVDSGGGRVFFTSTDQDGNFRVGGLFNVEQSTGTATLNADAFNLAGLNELSLGTLALGGGGATITEFSTDPFFTADSDSVIPTQRAIKAYIAGQIGGGGSSLNVNTLTAGVIFIAGQTITTTTNVQININSKVNFTAGVDGYPVALNLFLQA